MKFLLVYFVDVCKFDLIDGDMMEKKYPNVIASDFIGNY